MFLKILRIELVSQMLRLGELSEKNCSMLKIYCKILLRIISIVKIGIKLKMICLRWKRSKKNNSKKSKFYRKITILLKMLIKLNSKILNLLRIFSKNIEVSIKLILAVKESNTRFLNKDRILIFFKNINLLMIRISTSRVISIPKLLSWFITKKIIRKIRKKSSKLRINCKITKIPITIFTNIKRIDRKKPKNSDLLIFLEINFNLNND